MPRRIKTLDCRTLKLRIDCHGIISMVIDTVMQIYLRFEDGEIVQDVDEKLKLVESLVSMLPLVDSPQVTEMILKLIVCCFTALDYAPYGGMKALVHSYLQAVSARLKPERKYTL